MSGTGRYVAVDLGAESGRLMLGALKDGRLTLEEGHRFSNGPLHQGGTLRWDFPRLLMEIQRGLHECARRAGKVAGVGVDSWGVDFGLLDADGRLMENPYHYRDDRTEGMMEAAFRLMPQRDIYEHTGLQFMRLNTLYQLYAMKVRQDPLLEKADKMVWIADLVSHALCGRTFAEYTLASTSQMMDMRTGAWSRAVMSALGLPMRLLPEVVRPGTVAGPPTPDVARETTLAAPVIAVGSHDTASAVAAVPAEGGDWAYISSGTWSLVGVELPETAINDIGFQHSFTNEGGVEGTIRYLKNVMGLWIVQECRRAWREQGEDLSYARIAEMASAARPFAARICPDHGDFLSPGGMPGRIAKYLEKTGQKALTDRGEIVRAVFEGLAFRYRQVIEGIEQAAGRSVKVIHIVGGGSQNDLLNQFTADASGRPVVAGPVEATSIGNVLVQARAVGQIRSLDDLRAVVRRSFPTRRYEPRDTARWEKEYEAWRKVP